MSSPNKAATAKAIEQLRLVDPRQLAPDGEWHIPETWLATHKAPSSSPSSSDNEDASLISRSSPSTQRTPKPSPSPRQKPSTPTKARATGKLAAFKANLLKSTAGYRSAVTQRREQCRYSGIQKRSPPPTQLKQTTKMVPGQMVQKRKVIKHNLTRKEEEEMEEFAKAKFRFRNEGRRETIMGSGPVPGMHGSR
ncbi:Hypothetical protein D9617_20g027170 [Elsinoe fawcettii]|nr:Hypothetical protein D9617_20g027170 [Elsinoe fawcettii]